MTPAQVELSTPDELDATHLDGPKGATTPSKPNTRGLVEQELLGAAATRRPTMGRFQLLRRIGSGAMGVVFEAHDPDLDRRVALKVLRPEIAARPGLRARARMLREAQALARLRHPHVTMVYEVGTNDDALFIAMELVEGRTLKQWLRARRRSWREIVKVFVQAGRGLAAVHNAGLVHRDFKPDNLIVDDDGEARVIDFGLARTTGLEQFLPTLDESGEAPTALHLTATGAMLGTPAYMAPEQFNGTAPQPSSDQFSFCVALFEALYGCRPYPGNDLPTLQRSLLEGNPVAPRAGVPKRLYRVLCRGASVEPRDRYRDMAELIADLERCLKPQALRRPIAWMAGLTLACAIAALAPMMSANTVDSAEPSESIAAIELADPVVERDAMIDDAVVARAPAAPLAR